MVSNPHFSYVWFFKAKGNRTPAWERKHVSELPKLHKQYGEDWNCYSTVQHYSSPEETEKEEHLTPLFFDLDNETHLDWAKEDAKKVVAFFSSLGIQQQFIRVYFSGQKGFHIVIDPEVFGFRPHPQLTYIIKKATDYLAEYLEIGSYDDTVYSIKRLLRMPDTKHLGSGLYKVELYHSDLDKDIDEIKELAASPRGELYDTEEYSAIAKVDLAFDWFAKFIKYHEEERDNHNLAARPILEPSIEGLPVCAQDLLENNIRKQGERHKAVFNLANLFKGLGWPQDKALAELTEWSKRVPEMFSSSKEREKIANAKSVVRSVYANEKSFFACDYMRTIGRGTNNPIKCAKADCEFVKEENQEVTDVIPLPLEKAKEAVYALKKVSFDAYVSGKDDCVFQVPCSGSVLCKPSLDSKASPCHYCPIVHNDGKTDWSIGAKDKALMRMTKVPEKEQKTNIRTHLKIPSNCKKHAVEFEGYANIQSILLTKHVGMGAVILDENEADNFEYVETQGYAVNLDIEVNTNYNFTVHNMQHPKTTYQIHVIESATKQSMDLDKIEFSDKIHDELKIFQGDPETRFKEMHDDMEQNVYKIWGRRDYAIALDLIWHSAIGFVFQNDIVNRGWVQGVIAGDTGQAKSQLAIQLMRHYKAGTFVSSETSSRTGLLYSIPKINDTFQLRWGKFPASDRMMMILDELQQLHEEELQQMGSARENGFLSVDRVKSGTTRTRVRMGMIANPREGMKIDEFNQGCYSIAKLFQFPKDLRRCDFGIVLASDVVLAEEINKEHKIDKVAKYTSDRCAKLLQWIWSRRPAQVKFTKEAEDLILQEATNFSNKYGCKIALCEAGDMRLKVARLAAACAGRLYSTDDGVNLIVKPEHVKFICKFLHRIYKAPEMQLDIVASAEKKKRFLDEKRKAIVGQFVKEQDNWVDLANILLEGSVFHKVNLAEMSGNSETATAEIIRVLRKNNMIEQNTQGRYKKLPVLNKLLKILLLEYEEKGFKPIEMEAEF